MGLMRKRWKKTKLKMRALWIGYLDFSHFKVNGFEVIQSEKKKSKPLALITKENKKIVEELSTKQDFASLWYINGFNIGYKHIDKKIKKKNPSVSECYSIVRRYINNLVDINANINDVIKESKTILDYLLDLGAKEGSNMRALLYEMEEKGTDKIPTLWDFCQVDDSLKDVLEQKIKTFFNVVRTGKDVALFIRAMRKNNYFLPSEVTDKILDCIEREFSYSVGDRSAIHKAIKRNDHKTNDETDKLAKILLVQPVLT